MVAKQSLKADCLPGTGLAEAPANAQTVRVYFISAVGDIYVQFTCWRAGARLPATGRSAFL